MDTKFAISCTLVFGVLNIHSNNVAAQVIDDQEIREIFMRNTIEITSDADRSNIPFGSVLQFAFSIAYADSKYLDAYDLDTSDTNLLLESQKSTSFLENTFATYRDNCQYANSTEIDSLDAVRLASFTTEAEAIEQEDRQTFYLSIYETLSPRGKQYIEDIVNDHNRMGPIVITKLIHEQIAREAPDFTIKNFLRACTRLEGVYKSVTNPSRDFAPSTAITIDK